MNDNADEPPRASVHMQAQAEGDARVFQAGRDQYIYQSTLPAPAAVIRTLPRDTTAFTGRETELRRLSHAVNEAVEARQAVAIHAIDGMPGVGKTAFAVHAAHLLAHRFPDGQLFLRLHAHTPGQRPVDPADALAALLASAGVATQAIPSEAEARAALWRDRLAGKRVLLVLDDAAGHAQVEPLLPAAQGCLALITSRRHLAALVDAVPLALNTLAPDEAAELFMRLAARNVSQTEADAVAELVRLCGYLPLAVALLAGRLRHHPAWNVAHLATDLAMARDRLAELQAEDVAVAAAFDLSYQDLPAAQQRFFRRIGLHPGTDLDAYAAAALAGIGLSAARRHLDALYNDHLVDEPVRGRYRMHDLIREYATHLAQTDDNEKSKRAALTCLFDYYLSVAATALDTLDPAEQHRRPPLQATTKPEAPLIAEPEVARTWLDAERPNLIAVCAHATDHGWDQHTIDLATTLYRYLEVGGHYTDALAVHSYARTAARQLGDPTGEARALNNLGCAYLRLGRYAQAADHLQQARALFLQVADPSGEADTLTNLGIVNWAQGQLGGAEEHFEQALALFRQVADRSGEAALLDNLGGVYERQGRLELAVNYHQQALTLNRQIGYREGVASALTNLGLAYRAQGQLRQAVDCHQQALTLYRQIGYPEGEAEALNGLGLAYRQQGELREAVDCHQQALTLCRDIGQRWGEVNALNGMGEALYPAGAVEEARPLHAEALQVAVEIGDRYQQARAHDGLGMIYYTTSQLQQARRHWQHALTLYADLGIPNAETVRGQLTALDRQAGDGGAD